MSTDEPLFLLLDPSEENIKASISRAKYVIEVERNVDNGFQCRYFIESRDKVIYEVNEDETPAARSSTATTSSSSAAVSRAIKTVSTSTKKNSYEGGPVKPILLTQPPSLPTISGKPSNVVVELIPMSYADAMRAMLTPVKLKKKKKVSIKPSRKIKEEDVYIEVHVKDLFGEKNNPVAHHTNNCFVLMGCRFHQTYVGCIHKRVHVMKNMQRDKLWKEDEEPRKVTGEWLKGGDGDDWGV